MKINHPKVSIIILNWNGLNDTIECLESLKKITYSNYDIILVDNGSKGNDAGILGEKFKDYIHIIKNEKNYGYTGGNNIGIRYCQTHFRPDFFLILNNDTVVSPDFLTAMLGAVEEELSIGIVGPKVYYHASPNCIQTAGAKINMWTGQSASFGTLETDTGQYDRQHNVDCISGCCMLIRDSVIKNIGVFDESYFCYWDETDYCVRARRAGFKIAYAPEAKIWHKNPLPTKERKVDKESLNTRKDNLHTYYATRNKFKFMRKHADKTQYCSFVLYFFGWYLWVTTAVCLLYRRNIAELMAFYRGVRDGVLS